MPDPAQWSSKTRHRRPAHAPRVELSAWMRCMARRCEAQINRDWVFGFAVWNLFFRSSVNLARNAVAYDRPVFDERSGQYRALTSIDVESGAQQLVRALSGTYADTGGKTRSVRGDLSKLPYVKGLGPAARRLLQNMRHVGRSLPGTQEARRQMRFEIAALRIRYGVPLFVTVSPDEAHQWLFVRMARTRQSDPVRAASPWQEWICGDRNFPPLDEDIEFPMHVERVTRALPSWHQRRALLAREPLASVDGFHVLLRLLLEDIFGLRVCHACPQCDTMATPCMDRSGSNSHLLGGVFGRMDAAYVTIEAQKSTGSLHGHMQCFVQCVHQHTPLLEIFGLSAERLADLRREWCLYQSHVAQGVYSGQSQAAAEAAVTAAEATWPEHAKDTVMTSVPRYQWCTASKQQDAAEARQWQQEYLEEDVVKLQCLKQHHIHPLCPESGERVPLRGCQKQERKGVCKHEFPRTTWLCSDAKVLCPCELERHGFSDTGRRNRLGALHGPYGHEFLNPCHPAVLASMRGGNNDVQVPYRLPFACDRCGDSWTSESRRAIALGAQRAQDAQTGYCSDYCSKNQPMGYHEIKEFQKGHMALHASLAEKDLQTIGKRHATRFLSDAYCKGVVRGQVECCNLRANHREGQIVAAERISTAGFISFPGREYVALLEALERSPDRVVPPKKFIRTKPAPGVGVQHFRASVLAEAYGHRPAQSECWWLSPYEFTMWWELVPTRVPYSRQEWEDSSATAWDVRLTPAGERKLRATVRDAPARLRPGAEYAIRIEATPDRILFPSIGATAGLRRNWYLQRRARPKCPQFSNCPVPKSLAENAEANARLTQVYFRAWTLNAAEESENVPFLGHLLGKHESWEESLRHWLQLLPCAETKRNVGNFLSVYRVRPHAEAEGNSDDDGADEPIALTTAQLPGALRTQLPAQRRKRNCAQNDEQGNRTEEAMRQADALWPTSIPPQPPTPAQSATYEAICCAAARKAARAKPATTQHGLLPPKEQSAAVFCAPTHVKDAVRTWSAQLAETAACNPEQESFCAKVAARVLQELEDSQLEPGVPHSKPLRWVLHGGPGTGKSRTLKLVRKELFETTLGWTHGIHFQVVSFQAVMAELLEGDTIHHALGLNWAGEKEQSHLRTLLRTQETLQWRWLILDEFSMVSAELLAQLEQRCREIMRDLSLAKFRDDGAVEAFGGLNVILAGDLYQLPQPFWGMCRGTG